MKITNATSIVDEILERVLPVLREHFGEGERLRRLPDASAEALISSGAFLAMVPRALGGHELPPAEFVRLVEEISKVDSGAGFIVGNGNTNAYMMLALPEQGAQEVFADRRAVLVGGGFPPAMAFPVEGGYLVSGQAAFVSGAHLSTWVFAFSMILENGQPRIGPHGMPEMLIAVLPRTECEILDTWFTMGMRSSGSTDVRYTNVFVPAHRTAPLAPFVDLNPLFNSPVYRARVWAGHPAFAVTGLGVARAAVDAAFELAKTKTANYMMQKVGESTSIQRLLGRAEAKLRAARAFVYETVDELWQHQLTGDFVTNEHAVDTQLACSFAIETAREVTELVHEIAGTTGFREEAPFEQYFRDAHTMSQHAFTSAARFESAAKAMMGYPNDWMFFQL